MTSAARLSRAGRSSQRRSGARAVPEASDRAPRSASRSTRRRPGSGGAEVSHPRRFPACERSCSGIREPHTRARGSRIARRRLRRRPGRETGTAGTRGRARRTDANPPPLSSPGVRFRNPEGSRPQTAGLAEFAPFFLRRLRNRRPPTIPPGHLVPLAEAKQMLRNAGPESLTWLGHASFLLRTGGMTILTDPFLSERASPFHGLGPKRYVPPGLPIEALPPIDAIVISHNHYD